MQKQPSNILRGIQRILLFSILIFTASSMQAQVAGLERIGGPNATPEQRARRLSEILKNHISLTPVQEPKVYVVSLNYYKNLEANMKVQDANARSKTAKDLNKRLNDDFKVILTPEQYTSLQKQLKDFNKRQQRKRK